MKKLQMEIDFMYLGLIDNLQTVFLRRLTIAAHITGDDFILCI